MKKLDNNLLVTLKDEVFNQLNEPFSLDNKREKRPYFFIIEDNINTDIIWLIPCTTDKRGKHHDRIARTNPTSNVHKYTQFIKIHGIEQTLLFEKMIPVKREDIKGYYVNKAGDFFKINNPKKIIELTEIFEDIKPKLVSGQKFSRYQPDQKKLYKNLNK